MDFCDKKDRFCYICAKFFIERNKRTRSGTFQQLFRSYYEREWINEPYTPNNGCSTCYKALCDWSADKRDKPKYKIPAIWINPGVHNPNDCYFCVNKVWGVTPKKRDAVRYNSTKYTALPIEHSPDSPPLNTPEKSIPIAPLDPMDFDDFSYQQPSTSSYVPPREANINIQLISQAQLNNLCRELDLSQTKSKTLATELKKSNLLAPGVTVSSQKHRQEQFIQYFKTEDKLSFCSDIRGLMQKLNIDYNADDWRLFIDGSKSGFEMKAVLLHNELAYMPVPIAYTKDLKETYISMKLIFDKIKYNDHSWDFSGDLKVVALVMGLQLGRTKNACFICTWISTAKINHYRASWECRSQFEIGIMNVKQNSLLPAEKILLPTLHIKLGLIGSFIRKLDKESPAFKFLKVLFPKLSLAKLKAGINIEFYI